MKQLLYASGKNVMGDSKGESEGGLIDSLEFEEVKLSSMGNCYYEIKLPPCSGVVLLAE